MIFKRYGTTFHSVEPDFDSKALSEISFRRDRKHSISADEIEGGHERVALHELEARGEGHVHDEAEQRLLEELHRQIRELLDGIGDGELLVIESEQGRDWPKTRQKQKNVIVEGENRLYFHVHVEPPLRVGVYRRGA